MQHYSNKISHDLQLQRIQNIPEFVPLTFLDEDPQQKLFWEAPFPSWLWLALDQSVYHPVCAPSAPEPENIIMSLQYQQ